jgi:hypothetical protein
LRQNGAGKKSRPTEWRNGTTDHGGRRFQERSGSRSRMSRGLMTGLRCVPFSPTRFATARHSLHHRRRLALSCRRRRAMPIGRYPGAVDEDRCRPARSSRACYAA